MSKCSAAGPGWSCSKTAERDGSRGGKILCKDHRKQLPNPLTPLVVPYRPAGGLRCTASGDDWQCDRESRNDGRRGGPILCGAHLHQRYRGIQLKPLKARAVKRSSKGFNHDPSDMFCEVPEGHKRCLRCLEILPVTIYGKNKLGVGGYNPVCNDCRVDERRDRTYGNGAAQWFKETLAAQGGVCGDCGSPNPRGPNGFHLHHDHVTGKWLKVLCHFCNAVRGYHDKGWDVDAFYRTYKSEQPCDS